MPAGIKHKAIRRSFQPEHLFLMIEGAVTIPGFSNEQVRVMRRRLGLVGRDKAPSEAQIDMMKRIIAFGWCPHTWRKQSIVSIPMAETDGATVFTGTQNRYCQKCGCVETRMLTVDGYATKWCRAELPISFEVPR